MDNEEAKINLKDRFISWVQDVWYLLVRSCEILFNDNVDILASGLVYSTLVAFVPCFTFIFAVVQLFGVLQPLIDILVELLYQAMGAAMSKQIIEALSKLTTNGMGLGALGFVSFIFTTILLVNKIYMVINRLFRATPRSGTLKRFTTFFTFLILAVIFLSVVLALNTKATNYISSYVDNSNTPSSFKLFISNIFSYFGVVLFLFSIFYYVPNLKVRFKSALLGSLIGAVMLFIITAAFKYVVTLSVNTSVLYGSLSTVFFLLLYLYLCWYAVLIAAEFTYVYQFRPDKSEVKGIGEDPAKRIQDGINLIMIVASSYRNGEGQVSQKQLIRKLLINQMELNSITSRFVSDGFLLETNSTKKGMICYVPAKPLDQILVKDIVKSLYAFDEESIETIGEAVSEQFLKKGLDSFNNLTLDNLLERI